MYCEDFAEGQLLVTRGRTITETDVVMFAAMTGDYNPLHTDAVFGRSTVFGQRIAHGMLGVTTVLIAALCFFAKHRLRLALLKLAADPALSR